MLLDSNDLKYTILFSIGFILIIAISKIVYKIFPDKIELSRKTAHLLGGLGVLPFPYLFHSVIPVFIVTGLFFMILFISKLLSKGLDSIHNVKRSSFGAYLFPIAIIITFLITRNQKMIFVIAILTLAVSDTLAALIGQKYGSIKIDVRGDIKTFEGAVAFFLVTFLTVHIPLLLMSDLGELQTIVIAVVAAFIVCAMELISFRGSDNLFIPLGIYFTLNIMVNNTLQENLMAIYALLFAVIVTFILFYRIKYIKKNSKIALVLLNFASISFGGLVWLGVIVLSQLIISILLRVMGAGNISVKKRAFSVLIFSINPLLILLLSSLFKLGNTLFIAFYLVILIQSLYVFETNIKLLGNQIINKYFSVLIIIIALLYSPLIFLVYPNLVVMAIMTVIVLLIYFVTKAIVLLLGGTIKYIKSYRAIIMFVLGSLGSSTGLLLKLFLWKNL